MTNLGAVGLGLGLTAARGGSAAVSAQARTMPDADAERGMGPLDEQLHRRAQFYADFTGALADQLRGMTQDGRHPDQSGMGGNMQGRDMPGGQGGAQGGAMPSGAETVDAAIRQALMAVLDGWHANGRLTYGQTEAMKTLVATTPAPIGPSGLGPVLFGPADGAMRVGPENMAGGMHGGAMAGGMEPGAMSGMGGMHGGSMPPDQEAPRGRHGRRHR